MAGVECLLTAPGADPRRFSPRYEPSERGNWRREKAEDPEERADGEEEEREERGRDEQLPKGEE